jgi:Flp pilus assembly protein TadD
MLSALHVVAASPRVKDYAEAARLAGEQEHAALEAGGPHLQTHLASVDRHRGVLAFLQHHYSVALDHFTRAIERERTPENLGNVLATLLRLGELDEADAILSQVQRSLPPAQVAELQRRIDIDPDLATLRAKEPS